MTKSVQILRPVLLTVAPFLGTELESEREFNPGPLFNQPMPGFGRLLNSWGLVMWR